MRLDVVPVAEEYERLWRRNTLLEETSETLLEMLVNPSPGPWAWGENDHTQLGYATAPEELRGLGWKLFLGKAVRATRIAAGENHSLALSDQGDVYVWGSNNYGQLGTGDPGVDHSATRLSLSLDPSHPLATTPIKAIGAGSAHSLAVTKEGAVWAWGDNASGQLGNGDSGCSKDAPDRIEGGVSGWSIHPKFVGKPVRVQLLGEEAFKVTQVAGGRDHSLAVDEDGHLLGWGLCSVAGVTTWGSKIPVQTWPTPVEKLCYLHKVTAVDARDLQSIALVEDGSVYTWGLSHVLTADGDVRLTGMSPVKVNGALGQVKVQAIAAGACHFLALTTDGDVYAWGDNHFGQLGMGTSGDKVITEPRQPLPRTWPVTWFGGLTGNWPIRYELIAAGWNHSLAVASFDGLPDVRMVLAWGDNTNGLLDTDPSPEPGSPRPAPVRLLFNIPVTRLAAGARHSLALEAIE